MDQLHDDVNKLRTESEHLSRLLDSDDMVAERIELALAAAKRVRRDSTVLVRALARLRDQLQP